MQHSPASPSRPFIPAGYLNIMGYVDASEVNGPGPRAVVWLQGCSRHCPHCFNPDSCSFEINQLVSVEAIAKRILANSPVSSSNQHLHVFNPALQDSISWASDQLEIHVLHDGSRIVTGYRGTLPS